MAAEGQQDSRVERLAWLIESDSHEMPGMRLTRAQMRRLWNLSTGDCDRVLAYLLRGGRLVEDGDHRFGPRDVEN